MSKEKGAWMKVQFLKAITIEGFVVDQGQCIEVTTNQGNTSITSIINKAHIVFAEGRNQERIHLPAERVESDTGNAV